MSDYPCTTFAPLPEQAVDPAVTTHIRRQLAAGNFDGAVYPCGCQHLDLARSWRLCAYHDGLNDGMVMRATELEQLGAWKREAMAVIGAWEKVWVALGEPGPLGALKSTNSLAAIQQLVADRDRLRDAVAAHHDCCCTDLWPELRDEP